MKHREYSMHLLHFLAWFCNTWIFGMKNLRCSQVKILYCLFMALGGIPEVWSVDVVISPTTYLGAQTVGGHYVNALTTQGAVVVANGANITFDATGHIALDQGFSVASGGVFHAAIVSANTAPVVAPAAGVSPSPVTGTTALLSVLGADDDGEPGLTYVWSTTGTPPAAVAFSVNGTNAAKTTTATFTKAG